MTNETLIKFLKKVVGNWEYIDSKNPDTKIKLFISGLPGKNSHIQWLYNEKILKSDSFIAPHDQWADNRITAPEEEKYFLDYSENPDALFFGELKKPPTSNEIEWGHLFRRVSNNVH